MNWQFTCVAGINSSPISKLKMNTKVGLYLTQYRTMQHLTQKEMAAMIGVSREYYSKLEHSKGHLTDDLLERICSTTGAFMELLLNQKNGSNINKELAEMCETCILLKEKDRKKILKSMKKKLER